MELAREVCCDPELTKWHEVLGDRASALVSMPSTLMEGYKQAFSAAEVASITLADVICSLHCNGATTDRVRSLIAPLLSRYGSGELNNHITKNWQEQHS